MSTPPVPASREVLRLQLKQARLEFLAGPASPHAASALARQLLPLLEQLEPACLGLYWPLEGEFDPAELLPYLGGAEPMTWALPYARREGRQMQYRRWDGQAPAVKDEMGIPSSAGAPADPDVVLVPCLGFTREGYRLGYGGGYFDRWQAAHPGVTTVGLAWSVGEAHFAVEPHDQALTVVVTERELIAP